MISNLSTYIIIYRVKDWVICSLYESIKFIFKKHTILDLLKLTI
jgi:hypothetical protein